MASDPQPVLVGDTREILRQMRRMTVLDGMDEVITGQETWMPEAVLWTCYCELRGRGEPRAAVEFMRALKSLLRRRSIGAGEIPSQDPDFQDHLLVDDPKPAAGAVVLLGEMLVQHASAELGFVPG